MAYEMRISDWSSDVCSSDLISIGSTIATIPAGYRPATRVMFAAVNLSTNSLVGLTVDGAGHVQTRTAISKGNIVGLLSPPFVRAIGREPCRVRVCKYVSISVVAVPLKINKNKKQRTE